MRHFLYDMCYVKGMYAINYSQNFLLHFLLKDISFYPPDEFFLCALCFVTVHAS
jgi:hypothetical protein